MKEKPEGLVDGILEPREVRQAYTSQTFQSFQHSVMITWCLEGRTPYSTSLAERANMATLAGPSAPLSSTNPPSIRKGTELSVLDVGVEFIYRIPSFSVGLRQVTIQFVTMAGSVRVYDAFIRSDPSLTFQTSPFSIVLQEYCFVPVRNVFDFNPSS